jgi:hypothetical protein
VHLNLKFVRFSYRVSEMDNQIVVDLVFIRRLALLHSSSSYQINLITLSPPACLGLRVRVGEIMSFIGSCVQCQGPSTVKFFSCCLTRLALSWHVDAFCLCFGGVNWNWHCLVKFVF